MKCPSMKQDIYFPEQHGQQAQCVHDILSVYAILQKKKIVYEKIVQNMWGGN